MALKKHSTNSLQSPAQFYITFSLWSYYKRNNFGYLNGVMWPPMFAPFDSLCNQISEDNRRVTLSYFKRLYSVMLSKISFEKQ